MTERNGKVTVKQLYEEISPMKDLLVRIDERLGIHLKGYAEYCKENNNDHEEFSNLLTGIKIKVWAVAGLIGAIMGFAGVVIGKFI